MKSREKRRSNSVSDETARLRRPLPKIGTDTNECHAGKQRDAKANDPRRKDIQTEIRQLEDKIDKVKRQIDDERLTLSTLRNSADAQNQIEVLEEQCAKDLEGLEEGIQDHVSTLQKFNIPMVPTDNLSLEGDDNGDELVKAFDSLADSARSKYDEMHAELSRDTEELTRTNQIISEKTALMSSSQQTLASLKPKIERVGDSVEKAKKVAQDLRRHETALGLTVRVSEEKPRELVNYLDGRLAAIEEDAPVENTVQTTQKLMKRLKKLVSVRHSCV